MITASSIERVTRCPASAVLPQVQTTTEYAERGTAIHQFLADAKRLGRDEALEQVPAGEWRDVCAAIDVERLPCMMLAEASYWYDPATDTAGFLGAGLNRDYAKAPAGAICGTADAVGQDDSTMLVADYKTGWGDVTAAAINPQLRFLALCVARAYPNIEDVIVEVIRIRPDGSTWSDRATLDALELDATAAEIRKLVKSVAEAAEVVHLGRTPNVNETSSCKYCPAAASCPARTSLIRIAAGGGDVAASFLTGGLSSGQVGAAWVLAEQLDAVAKELKRRCHGALEEFGEVPTPRGTVLRKVITPGNERIDGAAAAKLLAEMFGPAAVEACAELDVSKKSLGAGLRKLHGKAGASNERAFLERLRRNGGISRKPSERVEEVSINERLGNG